MKKLATCMLFSFSQILAMSQGPSMLVETSDGKEIKIDNHFISSSKILTLMINNPSCGRTQPIPLLIDQETVILIDSSLHNHVNLKELSLEKLVLYYSAVNYLEVKIDPKSDLLRHLKVRLKCINCHIAKAIEESNTSNHNLYQLKQRISTLEKEIQGLDQSKIDSQEEKKEEKKFNTTQEKLIWKKKIAAWHNGKKMALSEQQKPPRYQTIKIQINKSKSQLQLSKSRASNLPGKIRNLEKRTKSLNKDQEDTAQLIQISNFNNPWLALSLYLCSKK